MLTDKWSEITVTKLDAAKRHIQAAIELWFAEGDPCVIHTVAAAGHQVIHRIAEKRGIQSPLIFRRDKFATEEEYGNWKKFLTVPENFFKHAQKDPDPNGKLTFHPEMAEWWILDATELLHSLGELRSELMLLQRVWMRTIYPAMFQDVSPERLAECDMIKRSIRSRADFLEQFRRAKLVFGKDLMD